MTNLVLAAALTLAAVGTRAVHAQKPSLPSDTIVRLAVDPTRFPSQPLVVLLDEGQYRIEPDGRWVQRIRQVHQVLQAGIVRNISERAFTWAPSHQALTIEWVRVLKPSGEVVSDKAAQEQESDLPAPMNNPVYQERRGKRISLAGVAPGTIVDIAWTLEEKAPPRTGDFVFQWNFHGPFPAVNSRMVVDVPEQFAPRIEERNLTVRRSEDVASGRRTITWHAAHLPSYRPARFEADSNGVTASVIVSAPSSWSDVAQWYHGLARDRYTLDAASTQKIDSVLRSSNAGTQLDTIRAIHRWVAQDIRYVSVALGIGGYQPRTPAEVVTTGFGDCKDKATIFIAALRRYGVPAVPVILSQSGRANARVPSIYQFDHVIAAVGDGASRTYTDLTAGFVPYGELPARYQGSFAIVVRPDGSAEEIRFPYTPIDSNTSTVRLRLTMDTTGMLRGHVEQEVTGAPAHGMRSPFAQPPDSATRAGLLRTLAQAMFPNSGTADSLVAFDGRDLQARTVLTYTIAAQGALRRIGANRVLSLPPFIRSANAPGYGGRARELAAAPPRTTPIDASEILGMVTTVTDVRITLPAGWKAELPKNVLATSFFGSYESRWTQEGDEVRLYRRIQGARGIHPPQRIAEVITWMQTTAADNYEFLTLTPPAAR